MHGAMQVKFAVYNCRTGFNRNNDDVVAQLKRETLSEHTKLVLAYDRICLEAR